MEPHSLRHAVEAARARFGRIDVGYYGPADFGTPTGDITTLDGAGAEEALRGVAPAVEFASLLIPELTERGSGGLLFAGGLSSVVPLPPLGGLALASAALRNYAITLNAALAPAGVYSGTITIGGLIDRGDIHQAMQANPHLFGDFTAATLKSRRARRNRLAPLHRTNRGESGCQRAGGLTTRGVVDRTGSPNRAAKPSLYIT
jgi:NAD(P)-dependent dehydrogenase (short-subunit alcohol dehydrogenase family)